MSIASINYATHKHPEDPHKFLVLDHITETAQVVEAPSHMVYVRMTERAEEIGGIYLPEKSRDEHVTLYEVIAIGRKSNTYRERQPKFKGVVDMDRNAVVDFKVGDTIIIPEKASGEGTGYAHFVKASPISRYEGYIDKGLILAKVV